MPLRVPLIFNLRRDPYERAADHLEHLLRLAARPRLPAGAGPGLRGQVPGDLPGVPAAPEGGQLQPRPGHGEADAAVAAVSRSTGSDLNRAGLRGPPGFSEVIPTRRSRHDPLRHPASGRRCSPGRLRHRRRTDPLPSWNEGPTKQRHPRLRRAGHRPGGSRTSCPPPSASPSSTTTAPCGPSSRSTSSSFFAIDRVKALAPEHPEWKHAATLQGASSRATCEALACAGGARRSSSSSWPPMPA